MCVGGVVCGCVWQMALASHPGASHATLTSPSCLLMPILCVSLPIGHYFPEGFAAFSFLFESQPEGQISPALLLREGQKHVQCMTFCRHPGCRKEH